MEVRFRKIRAKEKAQRDNYLKGDRGYKKRKTDGSSARDGPGDEEQYVLEDYESEREESHSKTNPEGLSTETLALMEQLGMITHPSDEGDAELEDEIKASETSLRSAHLMITDFLLLPHPLPTHTIHQ
jgi:chromosome transmission fidelity protein 1